MPKSAVGEKDKKIQITTIQLEKEIGGTLPDQQTRPGKTKDNKKVAQTKPYETISVYQVDKKKTVPNVFRVIYNPKSTQSNCLKNLIL